MNQRTSTMRALFLATAGFLAATPAIAQGLSETLSIDTPVWYVGNYEAQLEGFASGSVFTAAEDRGPLYPGGYDDDGFTGLSVASVRLQRLYDSGLITGLRANVLLGRDELSGDAYGNDFLQKLYFYVQTGLGRVEIGQQDGAGYTLGLTGPQVDPHVSLENPEITFFRNPFSDKKFNTFTKEITAVKASSNAAKISYISPRLIGIQIGASYTPNLIKSIVPFTGNPGNGANTQGSVWEFAASYNRRFDEITMGISAAYARGALRNPTPGSGDIYDWALGLEFQTELGETDLSWGGGYRVSSGYGYSTGTVYHSAETERVHVSALAERDSWRLGAEYSNTFVDAPIGVPRYVIDGYQAALGYQLNRNFQITAGWQHYQHERNVGAYYNGNDEIGMDAGFVNLGFTL
jgi:hypothetical protein